MYDVEIEGSGVGGICVLLDSKENILRIGYRPPDALFAEDGDRENREEKVLLWSGPRREVLQQGSSLTLISRRVTDIDTVSVGRYLPSTALHAFFFYHLYYWTKICFR